MTGNILGVDPGLDGAAALLSPAGDLIAVHDLPTLPDGPAGRRRVNPALLANMNAKALSRSEACRRWPASAGLFARVRDIGRSDACLIGLAGIMRERS
jgi:hypothetical protein